MDLLTNMYASSVGLIGIVMAARLCWRGDYRGHRADLSRYLWMMVVGRIWRELTGACFPRFDHGHGWLVSVAAQCLAFAARRPGKTVHSTVVAS
jgi:hypothetical protein